MTVLFTLILTDDDEDEHSFFKEALNALIVDVNFLTFKDGTYLLEYLHSSMFTPDLVFLDINMPLLNGLDTLKQIKAHDKLRNIPVVMYSTSAHKNDIHKAYKQGADLYFKKETSVEKLAAKLDSVFKILKENRTFSNSELAGVAF
jgi:CheY-like chemotaxis protein